MTLLELTVVILVLLSLVSILFIAANTWKKGGDRSMCIMQIRNVQLGVRGYANMYNQNPGSTAPGLLDNVIGAGQFVEHTPECPSNGSYSFGAALGEDVIPPLGILYMDCSLATSHEHIPREYSSW